jgi:hypothetical protein
VSRLVGQKEQGRIKTERLPEPSLPTNIPNGPQGLRSEKLTGKSGWEPDSQSPVSIYPAQVLPSVGQPCLPVVCSCLIIKKTTASGLLSVPTLRGCPSCYSGKVQFGLTPSS